MSKQWIEHALIATCWAPIMRYEPRIRYTLAAVEEYHTSASPAEYLLFSDGCPIAIVEAKKLAVGPQNVLKQAQRYAPGLTDSPYDFNGFHIPFIYSTNGEVIWFRDLRRPNSHSLRN